MGNEIELFQCPACGTLHESEDPECPSCGRAQMNHLSLPKLETIQVNELGRPDRRSWTERVHELAIGSPMNQVTLNRLSCMADEIHCKNRAGANEELIDNVEALAFLYAYKLQIMKQMDSAREAARADHEAIGGRFIYVD